MDNPGQVAKRVGELTSSAWVLSALATVLGRGIDSPFPRDDPAARVLVSYDFFEETDDGLVPTPAFAQALGERARPFADGIRSTLGQAATAAFRAAGEAGWGAFGDEILLAQGRASAMGGRLTAMFAIPSLAGLAERFASPEGGAFLDVGVGVAEMACALCEAVPNSRVVGLDPLPKAIELATQTVAAHGLGDRIELRGYGVEQLEDDAAFDLAWMPLPFIPPPVVADGLGRVWRALKPGGWLLLPGATMEPGASGEIARWQVHLSGGTLVSDEERVRMVEDAGFDPPVPVHSPPGAPPLVAVRRPE